MHDIKALICILSQRLKVRIRKDPKTMLKIHSIEIHRDKERGHLWLFEKSYLEKI